MKITAHKTRAVLLGLLMVSVLIGFATVYVLLDYGLAIRVIGTGLAGLAVATALFFLLRTLGALPRAVVTGFGQCWGQPVPASRTG